MAAAVRGPGPAGDDEDGLPPQRPITLKASIADEAPSEVTRVVPPEQGATPEASAGSSATGRYWRLDGVDPAVRAAAADAARAENMSLTEWVEKTLTAVLEGHAEPVETRSQALDDIYQALITMGRRLERLEQRRSWWSRWFDG